MPATSSAPSRSGCHQAHAAHRVLYKTEQERSLVVREGREIVTNEPQHSGPRRAIRHVEDRSLPAQAGDPVGRLHAGHAQQMNGALQKCAVVCEQLRLVAREKAGRGRRLEQRYQRVVAELHADFGVRHGRLKQPIRSCRIAVDEFGHPFAI